MRFEQACRFRAEGGYRVVSKSSGVTGADERVLELFSDAMNPLFNDTTQHVLTCLGKDGRVVLALSTMGSDAHARRALFTHAVFDAAQDFAEDPASLLSVPLDRFRCFDDAPELMDAFECTSGKSVQVDELLQTCGMQACELADFWEAIARAIASGATLCLRLPHVDDGPETIRAFGLLASEGLPVSFRRQLSFSSAFDCRVSMCLTASGRRIGGGRMVDYRVGAPVDPVHADDGKPASEMFHSLAVMEAPQRRKTLGNVQAWIDRACGPLAKADVELLGCAYALCRPEGLAADDASGLFAKLASLSDKDGMDCAFIADELVGVLSLLSANLQGYPQALLDGAFDFCLARADMRYEGYCRSYLGFLDTESLRACAVRVCERADGASRASLARRVATLSVRLLSERDDCPDDPTLIRRCRDGFGKPGSADEALCAYYISARYRSIGLSMEEKLQDMQELACENPALLQAVSVWVRSSEESSARDIRTALGKKQVGEQLSQAASFEELATAIDHALQCGCNDGAEALACERFVHLCADELAFAASTSQAAEMVRSRLAFLKDFGLSERSYERTHNAVVGLFWDKVPCSELLCSQARRAEFLACPADIGATTRVKHRLCQAWDCIADAVMTGCDPSEGCRRLVDILCNAGLPRSETTRAANAILKILQCGQVAFSWELVVVAAEVKAADSTPEAFAESLMGCLESVGRCPGNQPEANIAGSAFLTQELLARRKEIKRAARGCSNDRAVEVLLRGLADAGTRRESSRSQAAYEPGHLKTHESLFGAFRGRR